MEYVGAGVDYRALLNMQLVPIRLALVLALTVFTKSRIKKELNNGKVWAAITDHNGKFRVGDTFSVDQQSGFVSIPVGALSATLRRPECQR